MKFGHRVFATEVPLATAPRVASAGLAGTRGDDTWFRKSRRTQEVVHAAQDRLSSRRSAPASRHASPRVTAR